MLSGEIYPRINPGAKYADGSCLYNIVNLGKCSGKKDSKLDSLDFHRLKYRH